MCDICFEDGLTNCVRIGESDRNFYYDDKEQLTVCEHCVGKYLEEVQGE